MEIFELGGRAFRLIESSTFENQLWMERLLIDSGLSAMLQEKIERGRGAEYVQRVLEASARMGNQFQLLGGLLLPAELKDSDWAPSCADKTAEHLKKLTAPAEIARVRALLVSAVMGFFTAAAGKPQ